MWIPSDDYNKIKEIFPIPCVDIIVENCNGEILLLKRNNEPAKGQWWFPGGRVHFGEFRLEAGKRKLLDECGIIQSEFKEIGTYDLLLDLPEKKISHGITTVFKTQTNSSIISPDSQSIDYKWNSTENWLNYPLHPFIKKFLNKNSF